MNREQNTLAKAMNYLDDDLILAAHAPHKSRRRLLPLLAAACLIVVLVAVFPILREIIDTNSGLMDAIPPGDAGNGPVDAEQENKPNIPEEILPGMSVTLAGSTLTLTDFTDTTATLTLIKTDHTPLYAALYGLSDEVLASTEPDYRDNGVLIRPYTIRIYPVGSEQVSYEMPTAPGAYELVLDFHIVRNDPYPMQDILGIYAYSGPKGAMEVRRFELRREAAAETAAETAADTAVDTGAETDTQTTVGADASGEP